MSSIAFDTHAQVKRLRQSGFDEAQAEAIVHAVAGATDLPDVSQLATKDDVERLRLELKGVELKLEGQIKGLKGELIWWILGAVGVSAILPRMPEIVARLHG